MGGFLNPGMVWFAIAGTVPIIIHLLNRQRYKRTRWAAMEFLLEALKRTRRRLQIENLILLLIRVLIMVILAFALSRCYFKQTPLAALGMQATHAMILLDNSYSMSYRTGQKTAFDMAKDIAYNLINTLKPAQGDKLSLFTLSDHPEVEVSEVSTNLDVAKKKLTNREVSDYGTSMYKSLLKARDVVLAPGAERKVLYLITDSQEIAWRVSEEEKEKFMELLGEISNQAEVKIINVGKPESANALVSQITPSSKVVGTRMPVSFNVELTNYSKLNIPSLSASFFVDGLKVSTSAVEVKSYRANTVNFDCEFNEPGPHWIKTEIDSDNLEIDNQRTFALDVRDSLKVLLVNGEPSQEFYEDEVTFLRIALQPSRDEIERVTIYSVDVVSDIGFEESDLKKYDLVILANLEYISYKKVAQLDETIRAGGGLLIFLGDKVDRTFYNESLYKKGEGLLPGELIEIRGDKEHEKTVKLDKIDYNHTALRYFRAFKEHLTGMHIFEYYRMEVDPKRVDIRVLARYNDQDETPAIIEKIIEKGKVMVVTTSADDEWNLILGQPGYVMLTDQLLRYLVTPVAEGKNVLVGDPLKLLLKPAEYTSVFNLIMPKKGRTALSPAALPTGGFSLSYDKTDRAGLYTLEKAEERQTFSYFAVNPLPEEGDLRQLGEDVLRQRYPNFKFVWSDGFGTAKDVSVKPPASSIWKYLAYAVLMLLVLETILAWRFGAYKK